MAFELSKKLVERGHEVTVYTTDAYDAHSRLKDYKNPEVIEGVEVFRFKNVSNKLAHMNFPFAPGMALALRKNIDKFDVVHLHEYRSFQAIFVHKYAVKHRVPYVLQAHGASPRIIEKQNWKLLYDNLLGNQLLSDTDKLIAVSESEVRQYLEMGCKRDRICIVPNGLTISKQPLPRKGHFRKKINIKNNDKIILYVGRIHKRKGIDFLIKSFSRLVKELDGIELVLVGPDEGFRDDLERLALDLEIRNNVKFVGYINDVFEAYIDADVLVYPSIHEIFGLVPFEAIMCGTPVIVTDDCGCGEIIRDAKCGQLVAYGDENQLKNALKKALTENEAERNMVLIGQKYIRDNLSWNNVVVSIIGVYANCVCNV